MSNVLTSLSRRVLVVLAASYGFRFYQDAATANPTGGTVVSGSATFNNSGSKETITTGGNSYINWSSFNIGAGETTTFVEPSSSSVVWNNINGTSPSQILGNLNANGYVVLQNQAGFYVGGQASISTHGLIMTTASSPAPNLSGGGAWEFDAPPPTAKIINCGQINIAGGGSAFLIAADIENNGTISAPLGNIGLYAGETVLVSMSPDGRGLSTEVTLPQGSVDNNGQLIADGGAIAAQAQTVNQNGLVQANSVQNVNGTIELVASDSANLGANSVISAQGDAAGISSGGSVTVKSGETFSDQAGSAINISGGAQGGNGGQVEISAPQINSLDTAINGQAASGYVDGVLMLDPENIQLVSTGGNGSSGEYSSGTVDSSDTSSTLTLNVNSFSSTLSQINLQADNDIEVNTLWNLGNSSTAAQLTLTAGNNITLDEGSGIVAGNNWSLNLTAGTAFVSSSAQPKPVSGSDGVYLNGGAYLQTGNGNITVSAANEVIIQDADIDANGNILVPSGAIRTIAGGNISVTAQHGDVNSGDDFQGYTFGLTIAPYYDVNAANLGGISTAAGGNVTISAGGDVISYLPTQNDYNNSDSRFDGGSGAFGPEAGNVTITAGGNVYGNYVLANGTGTIIAGGNAGLPVSLTDEDADFALSLVKGGWSVSAQNIYLDDVINPNGVFNDSQTKKGKAGAHYFDYDPDAYLSLDAADAVEITGAEVPLIPASDLTPSFGVPVLLPPTLDIITGAGGLTLDANVILFPSPDGNVNITTLDGGNFESQENPNDPQDVNTYSLQMSDSGQQQWSYTVGNNESTEIFGYGDHAATPPELNNPNPVDINISGSLNDVNIYATKETDLTVGGNMYNSGFVGENLHSSDVTSINVTGSISYSPIYTLTTLGQAIVGANPLDPTWDSIFSLLVYDNSNPSPGQNSADVPIPSYDIGNDKALIALADSDLVFPSGNPGFVYNPSTLQLGYTYQMSSLVRSALEGTLSIIKLDAFGNPEVELGQASLGQNPSEYYFVTTTVSFAPSSAIEALYNASQSAVPNAESLSSGLQIGGPGQFNVNAGSLNLGASGGIVSWGGGDGSQAVGGGVDYASLDSLTGDSGASINVTVQGDLGMLTSTIASIGGGDVTVNSVDGEIDLGLASLPFSPPAAGNLAYGIYTSASGNVDVTAEGDINIDTARIATFNGGNVTIESSDGDVNAGNGVNQDLNIPEYFLDPLTGLGFNSSIQDPRPFGSGILALSPTAQYQLPGSTGLPGSILVETPNGNIVSTLGGISQLALDGSIAGGPTVTLVAGTKGVPASSTQGNIDLGQGGVIGGTVNLTAQGNITGLIVSRQNSTVTAVQNVDVTILSGGNASASAGGNLSGTLIGVTGISASGGGGITATLISSSVSANGGAAQSTLGVATASSASQSAANQSSADAKQQLANDDTDSDDDKKKKKNEQPLMQRIKRVTVILPKST